MLINFADKAVVGLAGVAVGFLANRFSTKTIMCVMGVVWAAALLPMSIVSSFAVLVGSRVVLGAAEGPAFPVAVHAVYKWFGNERRALPTSVVASGAAFGAGIVAPMIIWIIEHFGWHAAFGTLGAVGLAWVGLWLVIAKEGPTVASVGVESGLRQRVPYRRLLMSRTAIGFYVAGFAAYWDSGKLTEHTLHAELGEIVAHLKPGRESDQETILFWHRGLSLSDIALGSAILEKTKVNSIGQTLRFE
jgi:MFS family permease